MVQARDRVTYQAPHCWECPTSPLYLTEWRQPIFLLVGASCVMKMLECMANGLGVRSGKGRAVAVGMGGTKTKELTGSFLK